MGLKRYVHEHFSDVQPVLTDERHELRLAFDGNLAVGRDRETGWYCYR